MNRVTIIKIQGVLDTKWNHYFEGAEISYDKNVTILNIKLKDEPHLHGILNQIRGLNLKLISINPVEI